MINNFEKWFNMTNENLLKEEATETPTVSTAAVDSTPAEVSGRKGMMHDVDAIMTSLDALAVELTEELEAVESDLAVNEAGAVDAIKQWFISMKAAKAQQKVNKIKMNAADLEFASKQADGAKSKSIQAKLSTVQDQAKELQKMVDDKYGSKGSIVSSRISKEKIKGQLEIIKRTTGMEDDPNKKADLKTKMKELVQQAKEEEQAIADFEDKNAEEIDKEKEKLAKKAEKGKTPTEETPTEETPTEETPTEETPEEKVAKEAKAKKKKAKKKKEVNDSVQIDNDLITRARNLNLNELAADIESKLDWQVSEGTVLRSNYEAIIKKAESDQMLNESKYQVNSVKDAFRRLM